MYDLFADGLTEFGCCVDNLLSGVFGDNELQQLHDVNGIEKVCTDDASRVGDRFRNGRNGET